MKKKTIVFIEPKGSDANVFDNYMRLPLLGCLYLGTILHNKGHNVTIYNENILGRRIDPVEINADIVCISSLTLNANKTKELAIRIRQVSPSTKIFIGGIHPSLLPDEFLEIADHVVIGEAENIIVDLVDGKFSEKIVKGSPVSNLDDLPLIKYNLLVNASTMGIIPIMTSRGCPFDCNFCTVTQIFGRKYRKQSPERILAEIKNALNFFHTRDVFFYDDNLTVDRKRINAMLDLLINEKLDLSWTAQVRVDVAKDPELLDKMYKSGCDRFFIGFESINDDVLKSLQKSQTRADIEKAIKIIHNYGINIHGMFIFGDDHDSLENIEATVDFTINYDLDSVQYMILTPFPGTRTYESLAEQHRLIHHNWDYFNGMYVTFTPKGMTQWELQQSSVMAYSKFYSLNRTAMELLYFSFNVFFDALIWDFNSAKRYHLNNFIIKLGAKAIINEFLRANGAYLNFLQK